MKKDKTEEDKEEDEEEEEEEEQKEMISPSSCKFASFAKKLTKILFLAWKHIASCQSQPSNLLFSLSFLS